MTYQGYQSGFNVWKGGRTQDPLISFAFLLELGLSSGLSQTSWTEMNGTGIEVQVIDVWVSDTNGLPHFTKTPGTAKWQDVTLKRPYFADNEDKDFRTWVAQMESGNIGGQRVTGATITLFNTSRGLQGSATGGAFGNNSLVNAEYNNIVARWTFTQCWPKKYGLTALNAGGNEAINEELTLVVEGMVREGQSTLSLGGG